MSADTTRGGRSPGIDRSPSTIRQRVLRGAIGTTAFLVLWTVAALQFPVYLLPAPLEVAAAFAGQLSATATYTTPVVEAPLALPAILTHLLQSLQHYLPGLLIGSTLGVTLGVLVGWFAAVDDALTPVIRVLRPIPPLAWVAFAIVWFGIGHTGATFIVSIGAFWITFYNALSGVESVDSAVLEAAASLGVHDHPTMLRKVVLPAASPGIFTGLRTSIGQCWMIVVAAELVGPPGVGEEILIAAQNLALDVSVAYMLVISIVFLASDAAFRAVEREVLAWQT
ncbi:ABC transporter permease [Salarchaeum sp. JOR-1]|uniref:ABC transporter permease n=1 Tax=Salarchaeum sp. JOR-1 TaxID=2599399 RepID=UPI0011986397|nr:ABC transporter permease [Salarchaeum sp. JOR-1]QDX41469.1 ABC transporter permease [Salarchaeum sp. JOR-1]